MDKWNSTFSPPQILAKDKRYMALKQTLVFISHKLWMNSKCDVAAKTKVF